jgi:hypothetical protein
LKSGAPEPSRLFPRKLDHAQLRDHDRPAEYRNYGKEEENDFPGDGRVLQRESEAAGRENDRK